MSPEVYDKIQDLKSRLEALKKHFFGHKQAEILIALAEDNVAEMIKALEGENDL